jgi:hypothetical protein
VATAGAEDVARKRSGSESRRLNTLVRLDDELVERGKAVAGMKGISLGEYFSAILRPVVERDRKREARKILGQPEGGD